MSMATFNPQDVNLIITVSEESGVAQKMIVVEGYSEGTMIECSRNDVKFTLKSSSDGRVNTRSKKGSRNGTIKFTLEEAAPVNAYLTALFKDDEQDGEGGDKGICTIQMTDRSGVVGEVVFGEDCFLENMASIVKSSESGPREWTFLCAALTLNANGLS